jgi:hypothetical protein
MRTLRNEGGARARAGLQPGDAEGSTFVKVVLGCALAQVDAAAARALKSEQAHISHRYDSRYDGLSRTRAPSVEPKMRFL